MSPGSRYAKHHGAGAFFCAAASGAVTFFVQHHYHAGTAPGGQHFGYPSGVLAG